MSGHQDDREQQVGEPSFKVIDRRRFAPDGSERSEEERETETVRASGSPDAPTQEGATAEAGGPSAPAADPNPAERGGQDRDPDPGSFPAGGPDLGEPQGPPYEGTAEEDQPSFATLVLSLSTQALMSLGEIPEAPGAEPRADLGVARHVIDLLGILQQKTQGNLTEDEHALLERILYDLRMRYVQLSGS